MKKDEKQKSIVQKIKGLNKPQKIAFWSVITLLFYTIFGFLILPPVTKMVMEKKLPEILGRQVSIEKIKLNPYTLRVTIEKFNLQKKADQTTFVGFDIFDVNLQASSIIKRALVVKSILLSRPSVSFSQVDEQTFSFSDLIKEDGPAPEEESNPFLFSINNIEIIGGNIDFADLPKNKTHKIEGLRLAVPSISNLATHIENRVTPAFDAVVNGTKLSLGGNSKPFKDSRESIFDLKLTALQIPDYLAYIPNDTDLTIGAGQLDIDSKISFRAVNGKANLSLTGLVRVSGLDIVDKNAKSYLSLPRLDVVFKDSNLLDQKVKIRKIELDSIGIDILRQADGEFMPLALITGPDKPEENQEESQEEKTATTKEESSVFELTIDDIILKSGAISFTDDLASPFKTTIKPIDIAIKNYSTKPESKALVNIAMLTEVNESIRFDGEFMASPLAVDGTAEIGALSLTKYRPYIDPFLAVDLTSGILDVKTFLHHLNEGETAQTNISDLAISLKDFTLKDQDTSLIELASFAVFESEVKVAESLVTIGRVESKDAKINIVKSADGKINLTGIARSSGEKSAEPEKESEETEPWLVKLQNGDLQNYMVNFKDYGLKEPALTKVRIDSLTLADISTEKNSLGSLVAGITVNETGKINIKGPMGIDPFKAEFGLDINNVELKNLQPYVEEQVKVVIADGEFAGKGDLKLAQGEEFDLGFNGGVDVSELLVLDLDGEEMVKWKKLAVNGIKYGGQTQNILINEVDWQDLYAKILVLEDGSLNVTNLQQNPAVPDEETEEDEGPSGQDAEKKSETEIAINLFKMENGKVDFEDRNIKPAYAAEIAGLGGEIKGMSNLKESLAEVDFSGKINQHAPVKITGNINPLKDELFADLKLDFHDIDLSSTSPYTGKFIGYKTDKGKLTLNLHYTIDGKEIKAKNHAFLDQFTLGETVDSPDAVSLPIQLALALLKNRKGEITLNIPVQGNLDDPEFSIGGVIFKVIFNLIAKAATSPFALLGALIPDGEDLQFVEFEPGTADISNSTQEKLSKIAGVLFERPGLRMDIKGAISPEIDRKALAQKRLNQLVKLQKVKGVWSTPKEDKVDFSAIVISDEEFPKYFTKAYKAHEKEMMANMTKEEIAKEKEKKKANPDPTIEDMKKEMLAEIKIEDDAIRLLAIKRATNVMDFLTKSGPVEAERLFIIEPEGVPGEGVDKGASKPQVDLIIK